MRTPTQPQMIREPGDDGTEPGLRIELSDGSEQPTDPEQLPVAESDPLSDEQLQPVLDRLPELETEAEDVQEFRLPEDSPPPPRTGETITTTFPPPDEMGADAVEGGAPATESGPLEVLRFAPEGDVPIAPFVNVTFNQPMVPLATLQELAQLDVPVEISPDVPGTWKWLGTRTLSFEHDSEEIDRLPMATEYTVTVPAGTESATGSGLDEAISWTFRTPAPTVQTFLPNSSPQPRDPLFFVSFDQRIDPDAVLETVRVMAGGEPFAVRMASEEEIAEDDRIANLAENSPESRWLAFRTERRLPTDTTINVDIGPGTPSAEGPLTTERAQSFSFQTYAALRVVEHQCGYGNCPPLAPFMIRFNNPLDADAFDPSLVQAEPEIPGFTVNVFGNTLSIEGATAGRTTYSITVDGALQDIFGQTLGESQTLEFVVGSANPMLSGPGNMYMTLDPSGDPVFTVYSMNYDRLRFRAYAVQPEDWSDYLSYRQEFWRTDSPPEPPGQRVAERTVEVDGQPDELVETAIDLREALAQSGPDDSTGHLIVLVDVPTSIIGRILGNNRSRNQLVQTWVQATQIGLDAVVDQTDMVAWANALQDGAPLAGVELSLYPTDVSETTGADGTAVLPLSSQGASLLLARNGDDVAFLPQNEYDGRNGWVRTPLTDELRWYVTDDRQMYRPGEEVHIKGWLRRIGGGQTGDVGLLEGEGLTLNYRVTGAQGNDITDGTVDVSATGGFDLAFSLPTNANLGYANVQFTLSGGSAVGNLNSREYWHSFQIQEFRRPEFEVTAGNETTGPYLVGDEATVSVSAGYYAGGPLPGAQAEWTVSATPTTYSPPGWSDYVFGEWTPWWYYSEPAFYGGSGANVQTFSARTDASGTHYLDMKFVSAAEPRPYSVMADASVMDVNRQAWAASTSLMVHSSALYVGLRSENAFVEQGEPLEIEAIVTDIEGELVGGRTVQMRAARLDWTYKSGQWTEEEVDVQECTVTSPGFPDAEPVFCTFDTETGGRYRITATVEDEDGRANQTVLTRWVSGGSRHPAREVEREELTLVPDKEEYQPGDVAQILVQAPFAGAEGMLTVSRGGILYTERFEIEEQSIVLRVPVEDEHIPNLHVQVELVGSAPRVDDEGNERADLPERPAYAIGDLDLSVPPMSRTLDLAIEPRDEALEPGGTTTVDVQLTDAAGEPVADAELAVMIVDEAVLALTNYQLMDPISVFYGSRYHGVSDYHSRASIILSNPDELAKGGEVMATAMPQATMNMRSAAGGEALNMAAPAAEVAADMAMEESEESFAYAAAADTDEAAADDGAGADTPITVRSNFDPLALFAPAVSTDAEGRAEVEVTLPDNLTRYRIMVVAVAGGNQFGSGEANLTARLPLMVRPSAPRFLNFGDRFELPVVLQNQTDEPMDVDVVVRTANVALLDAPSGTTTAPDTTTEPGTAMEPGIVHSSGGQRVTVPANDRVEVRFPATTVSAGQARMQIAATSSTEAGNYADAATVDLPVYTPATTEAFAVYGVIDEGAVTQPIAQPQDVFPQFGGLSVDTSSTALQALTDALLYLVTYPYECSEQIAARILAVASLRDVLTAFDAEELPEPDELVAAVERDVERLQSLQNGDGGFPIWRRGQESVPYYSIFVAHALQVAADKGFTVSNEMRSRTIEHLRNIESYYPHWYGQQTRWTLSAYALYVRSLSGDVDLAKARSLFDEAGVDGLTMEGLAWLLHVLGPDENSQEQAEQIRRHFQNNVVETPGAAHFITSYGDDEYVMLHSNRRTDGVVLDALIADQPESDLIPKLVNGLLAHRSRGRWNNTQENGFILLALDHYFNTFEAQTPDFVADIWLGDTYVAEHEFQGRTTERLNTEIPMSYLTEGDPGTQDLVISKEGEGRLYYRLGLRYAPTDLDMPPVDMGFVVQRTYEAVDDPEDVTQDEDGVWHIRAGARVRTRVTMVADSRRYHVALVDPLPAGMEIINPALAVSENVPSDPNDESRSYYWWWGPWYQHQNLRDQRAEAFTTLLWDGVYEYSYVSRATTPGEFVVPPAKAEEMYSPEVFGRSGADRVIIE